MTKLTRRIFLNKSISYFWALNGFAMPPAKTSGIITVLGPIADKQMGTTLIHEHILVDFIGAGRTGPNRWEKQAVINKMLPYLKQLKMLGCKTIFDCTPSYLGKDPMLLKQLSQESGLHIITNTGYYGAVNNKYLPEHAFLETADQLANRWIHDFRKGMDGTEVKPGFIKISVNPGSLSDLHRKLVKAAALAHLSTGMTICSHTGPSLPAFEQIDLLKSEGVNPGAFVWVHAQNNPPEDYLKAIGQGAWISLDGIQADNLEYYKSTLVFLKKENCLHQVLISHDAGWYDPALENGGPVARDYTIIFNSLIPALRSAGFTRRNIRQLLVENPARAFSLVQGF